MNQAANHGQYLDFMFIYQSIVILRPPRPHTGHAQLLAEESLKEFSQVAYDYRTDFSYCKYCRRILVAAMAIMVSGLDSRRAMTMPKSRPCASRIGSPLSPWRRVRSNSRKSIDCPCLSRMMFLICPAMTDNLSVSECLITIIACPFSMCEALAHGILDRG